MSKRKIYTLFMPSKMVCYDKICLLVEKSKKRKFLPEIFVCLKRVFSGNCLTKRQTKSLTLDRQCLFYADFRFIHYINNLILYVDLVAFRASIFRSCVALKYLWLPWAIERPSIFYIGRIDFRAATSIPYIRSRGLP